MTDSREYGTYTQWSGRKTFKEEKDMVIRAITDENTDEIKNYLNPLVEYWGNSFKEHLEQEVDNKIFFEAGFTGLQFALRNYHEKLEKENIGFKFSTYFEWFIRQGFVEYLKDLSSN